LGRGQAVGRSQRDGSRRYAVHRPARGTAACGGWRRAGVQPRGAFAHIARPTSQGDSTRPERPTADATASSAGGPVGAADGECVTAEMLGVTTRTTRSSKAWVQDFAEDCGKLQQQPRPSRQGAFSKSVEGMVTFLPAPRSKREKACEHERGLIKNALGDAGGRGGPSRGGDSFAKQSYVGRWSVARDDDETRTANGMLTHAAPGPSARAAARGSGVITTAVEGERAAAYENPRPKPHTARRPPRVAVWAGTRSRREPRWISRDGPQATGPRAAPDPEPRSTSPARTTQPRLRLGGPKLLLRRAAWPASEGEIALEEGCSHAIPDAVGGPTTPFRWRPKLGLRGRSS